MIEPRLPAEPCLVTVALWLEDGDGTVRARNYVNVDVYERRPASRTWSGSSAAARCVSIRGTSPIPPGRRRCSGRSGHKFGAGGAGWVEYALPLPEDWTPATVSGMRLLFEASARTASSRIGWKVPAGPVGPANYPQTEARKLPTATVVSRSTASRSARAAAGRSRRRARRAERCTDCETSNMPPTAT